MTSKTIEEKAKSIWEIENNADYSNEQKMQMMEEVVKSCSSYELYKIDEYIIEHYTANS